MNGLLFVVRLGVLLLAELAVLLDEAAAVPELEASDVAAVLVVAACPVVEFSTGGAFLQGGEISFPGLRRRPVPLLGLLGVGRALLLLRAGVG